MDARMTQMSEVFRTAFGGAPQGWVRAPGRVNLIGEHTDYNDGFCLPMAIDRDQRIGWRANGTAMVRVVDAGHRAPQVVEFPASGVQTKDPRVKWADYLKGCAVELAGAGLALVGCDLVIHGTVPLGSGLSSSAALEVATIHALLAAAGRTLDGTTIARLGQKAENRFVGTNCGILDQLSSSCAVQGQAMLMDCRTCGLTPVPLPPGMAIVIADTGKRRGLVDSAYNERRAACEAGAAALGVSHLRDVTLHGLCEARAAGRLDATAFDRCAHVVAENGRTIAAAACLRAGDAVSLGQLMDQSHCDLQDRFAVTCPELDCMVRLARRLPGCLGSRMTGAGFGGCTVSLVEQGRADAFCADLLAAYARCFDLPAAAFATSAAAGAGPFTPA